MAFKIQLRSSFLSSSFLIGRIRANGSSTLDAAEMQRFSQLGQQWWDRNGPFKALHAMNNLRVPWISDAICTHFSRPLVSSSPLSGVNLLEVGCGGGLLSERLARLGAAVYAVDSDSGSIEVAKRHAAESSNLNIQYAVGHIDNVRDCFRQDSFDVFVASEVLEHVNNWQHFVGKSVQLVRPNGLLFFTTINKTLLSRFLAIFLAENVLKIVPKGVHDWQKFIAPQDLRFVLERNGCSVRGAYGTMYNPLSNKWSWCNSVLVNYALYAVKNK